MTTPQTQHNVRSTVNLQLVCDSEADPKHLFKRANRHMAQRLYSSFCKQEGATGRVLVYEPISASENAQLSVSCSGSRRPGRAQCQSGLPKDLVYLRLLTVDYRGQLRFETESSDSARRLYARNTEAR